MFFVPSAVLSVTDIVPFISFGSMLNVSSPSSETSAVMLLTSSFVMASLSAPSKATLSTLF